VVKRAAVVALAGIITYLVFPAITEVPASWPRLSTLDPRRFTAAIGAEIAHFACTFALQRLALRRIPDPVPQPPGPPHASLART
jgi:hypothetical protein